MDPPPVRQPLGSGSPPVKVRAISRSPVGYEIAIAKTADEQPDLAIKPFRRSGQPHTAVIAEWDTEFDDIAQGVHTHMREMAVLVFEGSLIASLREYWALEQIGSLGT